MIKASSIKLILSCFAVFIVHTCWIYERIIRSTLITSWGSWTYFAAHHAINTNGSIKNSSSRTWSYARSIMKNIAIFTGGTLNLITSNTIIWTIQASISWSISIIRTRTHTLSIRIFYKTRLASLASSIAKAFYAISRAWFTWSRKRIVTFRTIVKAFSIKKVKSLDTSFTVSYYFRASQARIFTKFTARWIAIE